MGTLGTVALELKVGILVMVGLELKVGTTQKQKRLGLNLKWRARGRCCNIPQHTYVIHTEKHTYTHMQINTHTMCMTHLCINKCTMIISPAFPKETCSHLPESLCTKERKSRCLGWVEHWLDADRPLP